MTVHLRPLQAGDEDVAVRWANDREFCLAADWTPGLSARTVRRHWQAIIAGGDPTFRRWGIMWNGGLIGYVDLGHLTAHSAELGIAIGNRDLWGQGLARRACSLALAWAWTAGLAEVTARVHQPNGRSHALMRHLGFVADGCDGLDTYRGEVVPVQRYRITHPG
ncbi:GNAT family N-acetyltransferase [Deinococcus sp. KSM4-11]|uniref:GNAT family N-acetyltransferase n=1 Tax=Deinococcus sp. KSM4-11 TaxID=2568654 RepID=UPI0010A4E857|nr:GNAT family N-acetyltransferase [Deinococcus sp. KSM4-11]THF88503.1 GNAT family N-acetyltransferase [Deinococcus sp. KSM4-11]